MRLVRTVDTSSHGKESVEWVHWISNTQWEILLGREADIAEEAYQQGLAASEEVK